MSYQVVELVQLAFALLVMFGAFLGGIAVGWWRWGSPAQKRAESQDPSDATLGAGLFSAHERTEDIRDRPMFDTSSPDGIGRTTQAPTFAATREIGVGSDTP